MENMSKALLLAGGVLISIMVIGVYTYMYQSLSETQQEDIQAIEIEKITEYNKKFEVYNTRILYGSDILSIANLIEDYNKTETGEKGYKVIEVKVTIKEAITPSINSNQKYKIKAGTSTIDTLRNKLIARTNSITSEIESLEGKYGTGGRMSLTDLNDLYLRNPEDNLRDPTEGKFHKEVQKNVYTGVGNKSGVIKDINQYSELKTMLKEFKLKIFSCTNVQYDKNGRIIQMDFSEADRN